MSSWSDTATAAAADEESAKRITFLRHGCTFMNEYMAGAEGGKRFGAPDFTDVFAYPEVRKKYHDTQLSPRGRRQAMALASNARPGFIKDCELVVVSPLTRALQTFDVGLKPHFDQQTNRPPPPVVAHPDAAERLYLISDTGRPVAELRPSFPYVDFATGFAGRHDGGESAWWYQPDDSHEEWRPVDRGQRYACPSEPAAVFDRRMSRLYAWLENRPERNIAVVCHHGVIDWMLDMDFANCQYRQVTFDSIQPRALLRGLQPARL